jgi:UDP-N-acetylmuramate dehydrogenase
MSIIKRFDVNYPLKNLSTFGIGGPAKYFIIASTSQEMSEILRFCDQEKMPYLILGKGSNCLFDDRGYNGLVVLNKIDFNDRISETIFKVGAGYSFSLLGVQTARMGFSGLEFASGIPGSVGGAVFMNAGANGSETKQTLVSVDFVNSEGELITFDAKELSFSYRHSPFHYMQGAITSATFQLTSNPEARQKQIEIVNYRKKSQPLKDMSAGCIFRNPENGHAGALIDQCGLKGMSIGDAKVSEIHANFIVNKENATAQEVLALIEQIKEKVKEKTGFTIEPEIRCIPFETKNTVKNLTTELRENTEMSFSKS